MKGYLMSLEVAEKFFKRCAERQAETLKARMEIMLELIHEENVQIIKQEQMEALAKDKKVLFVKRKKK